MSKAEKDLTTGQMAKIAGVSPRTVAKWCDSGALKGHRIPMTSDRRVSRAEFARFLESHGMGHRLPDAAIGRRCVMFVGFTTADREPVAAGIDAVFADNMWQAGFFAATERPAVVVIDSAIGNVDTLILARSSRGRGSKVVATYWNGSEHHADKFDAIAEETTDVPAVVRRLLP